MSRKRSTHGSPPTTANDQDEESPFQQRPDQNPANKLSTSPVKVLINKIKRLALGTANESNEGVTGLLQDLVGGIVLGALGMSILLLLDYANIINLETARVFRKTASANIFNNPELIEMLREEINESGSELIPMADYHAITKELSDSKAVIDEETKIVNARTKKETALKGEIDSIRGEYNQLYKDLGLEIFCPTCHWGMGMNCKQRVDYMLENYSDTATTMGCIWKLVEQGKKNGKCLKPSG